MRLSLLPCHSPSLPPMARERGRNPLELSRQTFHAPGCHSGVGTRAKGDTRTQAIQSPAFSRLVPPPPRPDTCRQQSPLCPLATEHQGSYCLTPLYGNSAPTRGARVLGSRGHLIMGGSKFLNTAAFGGHFHHFKCPGSWHHETLSQG